MVYEFVSKNKYYLIIIFVVIIIFTIWYYNDNIINKIDKIYSESFITVDNTSMGPDYNLTYGEIMNSGVQNISKYLDNNSINKNTFIDLGSGSGRSLAYAIANGFKNAKGVEIVDKRYNYAINTKEKLPNEIKNKMQIDKKDMFQINKDYIPKNSIIFVSNLVFPEKTNQKLIKHLSEIAPNDTILILSKVPNNLYKFKLIEKIRVPMSWQKDSESFVLSKYDFINEKNHM
jgi:predicted nicotinamide N-methyase